jgi:hypothetical protein
MTRIKFTPPLKNGINQHEMVIMGKLSHVSTRKNEGIQYQLEKEAGNNDGIYKTYGILFGESSV